MLRYYEDLSEAEIARVLDCRPGTVRSLASRALDRLRQELSPMTTDLETRLTITLTHVAETTPIPPLPALDTAAEPLGRIERTPRFARRRAALAGIAAVVVLGGGLSIAAAAGAPVLPGAVVRALGWAPAPGAYNSYPATTRKLFTVPGPDGVPLNLWYSDANDNGYCVELTSVVTPDPSAPGGLSSDPQRQPRNGAGGCGGTGDSAPSSARARDAVMPFR